MTLDEMRDAVRVRLGVPATDNFFTDTILTDLINEALQAYASEYDWPWLMASTTFPSVAGTETYAPPADWVRTQVITAAQDYPLAYISLNKARERNMAQDIYVPADPDCYTIAGDQLMLSPIPKRAITYTHDYVKAEPFLSGDSDEPVIPDQWVYAVVAKATSLGYMRQNDEGRAAMWEGQYAKWLIRMRDNRRRTVAFPPVRVRPGSMI